MSSDVSALDGWTDSNLHAKDVTRANLGKVTRFTPSHARRAAEIRAEIAEQRSMEPPKRGDKAWFWSLVTAWSAVIGVAIWTALS